MGAVNYDDALMQLRLAGLDVQVIELGRMQRCRLLDDRGREKRGWYCLREVRFDDGRDVIVGGFGVWRGNENNAQKIELRDLKPSTEQREAMKLAWAQDRKRADQERADQARRAAERARTTWERLALDGESDYLARKGVAGYGVRYSPKTGALVIPLHDVGGRLHGLQLIRGKNRPARAPEKQFWPAGMDPKGHYHLIGVPGDLLLIAEGYATAASVHAATGLPVAVAFNAGNLLPVAVALRGRYKRARILIVADDDATQKCSHAECRGRVWLPDGTACPHCGQPHGAANAGLSAASAAALAVRGEWMAPVWADPAARRAAWLEHGRKLNDFNDLAQLEGTAAVRAAIETRLLAMGWNVAPQRSHPQQGGGGNTPSVPDEPAGPRQLRPIDDVGELLERFSLVYGMGKTVFDHQEHLLVPLADMQELCVRREIHRAWSEHPDRRIFPAEAVGFDPTESDAAIACNLWAGWPTRARAGQCQHLLDLLAYMCGNQALYEWVLRWLAYPLQHPGAKMQSALVVHGPSGTGKNLFFECVMRMYGPYGRVINQSALEDKFNDWASRKLFLLANEVVARADLYHVKNLLKAFITDEWIRINPKNMAARDERNHANLVFLSNEAMPVVLDADDRRHAVIWTPEKLSQDFYTAARAEVAAGGEAALHHHLLHLDLGDFHPGILPPMTEAKRELIGLSLDSPRQFANAFERGDIEGFPAAAAPALLTPCLSTDIFELYSAWCQRNGLRALSQPRLANALMRHHRVKTERKRYRIDLSTRGPATIVYWPGGQEQPPGEPEQDWLGDRIGHFQTSLKAYRLGGSGK